MKTKFTQYVNMTNIVDSLQLPSGSTIASLEYGNGTVATIEVRGEVNIDFEGVTYRDPAEFPEELKQIIAEGRLSEVEGGERLYVNANNWFEFFFSKEGDSLDYDVIDAEKCSTAELYELMAETVNAWEEKMFVPPKYEDYISLSDYDLAVMEGQLATYGMIFLDEYGKPVDNEYEQEELFEKSKAGEQKEER